MSKIFIGIPTVKNYMPFWDSLYNFTNEIKEKYNYEIFKVHNRPIDEARNTISEAFINSDSDYLLFLDDDHSGHNLAILDALIQPLQQNASQMCGIKCHTKYFPYNTNTCIYSKVDHKSLGIKDGSGKYIPIDFDEGYFYMDLIGFGMTLLTKNAFYSIEKPYFVSENYDGRLVREDNYFCDKLISVGIKPIGYFGHDLPHYGITKNNARRMYEEGFAKIKEKYPDLKVMVA